MKNRVLFIDRDGTILVEPPEDFQVDSLEKLEFVAGAISGMKSLAELDYELVLASNQDGLGTDAFPEETFWPAHTKMLRTLAGEGVFFDDQLIEEDNYYLTIDQSLKGTGTYYAVIDVSDSQGMLCDGLMRSVLVSYAGSQQPAKVALFPTAVSMGQTMQLKGLNPNENSEIYIYSTTGQLIEQFVSTNETTIQLHAGHVAGCYQVVVKSPSISQTLRYIVNNR